MSKRIKFSVKNIKLKRKQSRLEPVVYKSKVYSISTVSVALLAVILANFIPPSYAATQIAWDFANSNDYTVSDEGSVNTSGGNIALNQVNIENIDDSQGDFSLGSNTNTLYTSNRLTIGDTPTSISSSASGLIAQFRMEENWNNEKGTYNGTALGGPSFVPGVVGSAGNFDGTDDQIVVDSNFGLTNVNITMEMWVNLDSTSEKGCFVKIGGTGNGGIGVGVGATTFIDSGNDLIILYEGVRWIDTNIPIGTGWRHIVVVVDSAGLPKLYIDGHFRGSFGGGSAISPTNNNVLIGGHNNSGSRFVDAYIDEVSIYNIDVSHTQILQNYQKTLGLYGEYTSQIIDTEAAAGVDWQNFAWVPDAPYSKNLPSNQASESAYSTGDIDMTGNIGLWHFNGNLADSSGAGVNVVQAGGISTSTTSKIGNGSLYFDGSNDYLDLMTGNYMFQSGDFSTAFWANASSLDASFDGLVSTDNYNYDCAWRIVRGYNQSRFTATFGGGVHADYNIIQVGSWNHYALTKTGTTLNLYQNGSLVTSATVPATHNCGNATKAVLGTYRTNEPANFFHGYMDEFAIWNRTLSSQEISSIYQRGTASVKYQVRSCDDPACSGESFLGSDGTSDTYYSEANNTSTGLPSFAMANINNNRYFQYKAILEADNALSKPQIASITSSYLGYPANFPSITPNTETDLTAKPKSIDIFCEGTLSVGGDCTPTSTKPSGTELYYQICNDTISNCNTNSTWKYWDGDEWTNATQTTHFNTASDINSNLSDFEPDTRYFAFKAFLASDGQSSPTLADVGISVTLDGIAPVTNAQAVGISGKSKGDWVITKPTIQWTEGEDDEDGTGILGYCVALDEVNPDEGDNHNSSLLNPEITAGKLQGLNDGLTESFCPFISTGSSINLNNVSGLNLVTGKQYNVSLKAVDYSGNIWNGLEEDYQDMFWFKYDGTPPTNPAFISMPSNFIQTKDVTITWPTDPTNGAKDEGAGLAGLQYKIGNSGTWYGDLHSGSQDLNDLVYNDGSYTTNETYDYPNLTDGNNVIYFRTLDLAGNVSSSNVSGVLRINTTAPDQVNNLQVTPANNTTNSYTFSWSQPSNFIGEANKLTYCYTVNTLPSVNTCIYTAAGVTSLPADAFANQPGTNTFYVVAKDEAGNINYETRESITFTYSGSAPGMPMNLDVSDISTKETQDWKLAVTWVPPTNTGAGVTSYRVFRSDVEGANCSTPQDHFTQVSTVLGTSYIDTGLEQKDYYYCARACDSANNCSAVSATKFNFPSGKYTEPAELTSGPNVNAVTTRRAAVSWTTDRRSDSRIEYGLATNMYFEEEVGNSAQVTAHTVSLSNLEPGTTYYYRAKWTDEDGNTGLSEEKQLTTAPAPIISGAKVQNIGISSAIVNLTATGATKVNIYYGQTTNFGGLKPLDTAYVESNYNVLLDGLADGSRYYFKINPVDLEGYEYQGTILEFTTLPRPLISNVQIEEVKNVAQPTIKVTWNSNTNITSVVDYYPVESRNELRDSINLDFKTEHQQELVGLKADTTYALIAKGTDEFGNQALSTEYIFTTATDTRPPQISNLKVEGVIPADNSETVQLIVSWETDELASSQVEFGEGATGDYLQASQIDRNLSYKHVVVISNLKPASVYHLRAVSADNSGNTTSSRNEVTITPKKAEMALDIVLKGLSNIFGFF